jgi:N-acetylglutamate synthase-like GNAT family acetyltransferase
MRLVRLSGRDSSYAGSFLSIGKDYLEEQGMSEENVEKFLLSILDKQTESNRRLYLLEHEGNHIGLIHMKIDYTDRPNWGFIMECYIKPEVRRKGFGSKMYEKCEGKLKENGIVDVYLSTNKKSEPFWSSLGFEDSGEIDAYNNQKIMTKSIT